MTFCRQEFSREVSTAEGQAFADRMGSLFVEASAKTAVGVKEAFTEVVEKILENSALWDKKAGQTRTDHGRGGVPGGVQVVGAEERTDGGGCAC